MCPNMCRALLPKCTYCCFFWAAQDFLGKRSQLKARPSTNELLFSYAGKGSASGSLSVKLTQWKPRPKRVVITAAIIKSGATMVELNLGANHELVATIMSGGKTATLTHGVKHVGSMTVTIVPGALSWAASCTIKTPDLTFTAEQVGVTWYAQENGSCMWARATTHHSSIRSCSCNAQEGFLGAPKKPAGILVRSPAALGTMYVYTCALCWSSLT